MGRFGARTSVGEWAQAYAIRALSKCPMRYRNVSNYQAQPADRILRPQPKQAGGSRFDKVEEPA